MAEEIVCKISKDRNVIIRATKPEISLEKEVFAVNWFNTKRKSVYNLYNRLASGSVIKVGGKPLFKGEVTKKLLGDDKDHRSMLLIVNYPSVYSFKNLLDSTYFKLVSILRVSAVDHFNFGFTHKNDIKLEQTTDKSKAYAVHHFKGNNNDWIIKALEIASKHEVKPMFSGTVAALLHAENSGEKTKQVPCIFDGVLLWHAENEAMLNAFFSDNDFQTLIKKTSSSYIGFLNRLI